MTSLRDRPNAALLVVDVQNDVVANTYHRDDVIANIRDLIGKARASRVPVVWVQHSDDNLPEGSDGWQYVPELQRQESEPLVHKKFGDADTLLVADAHTTEDFSDYGLPPADKVIAHTNMYWTWQTGPGRMATVVDAADVDFHEMQQASS